ncbi:glycosyltransferase [Sphingomonas sp. BAUL-RG-20F-R05-02]|uniref:glycosyltransferase n=1 Tax=Sphingomonas sp. BAUL-RG-20F-R05-02 TaxID=2914830 RepID=UPI001F579752|nr:glycosyltransferase [Sphingomonas sp. BAUL-RG-20F-R05-02]
MANVHIVLSDQNWIIEELAKHLVHALPYVSADIKSNASAEIQYYMTYSARTERVSPVEIALFTHREDEANAARRFNDAAKAVDHAVSMSQATDRLVAALGVEARSCISPGVDLERFRPQLKIAVVGRTYHTGRKGEALVRAVMDIPDIEWHFTGSGWPGPALHLAENELPTFYRSMDYILVPATNEGGPMSVLEALASGVPVIASDVGWAAEYPHIAFERGDAASLRAVLEQLRAERFALRENVAGMTWSRWVGEHDRLFADLISRHEPVLAAAPPAAASRHRVRSVALLTHGAEDYTLGGPSVRVPRTQEELTRLGLRVTAGKHLDTAVASADVAHGFNIWTPTDAYRMACQAKRLSTPLVFSPILLDLSEAPFWQVDLLRAFRAASDAQNAEARIDDAFAGYVKQTKPPIDFEPGYTAALRAINEMAAATVFLSDKERKLYERLVGAPPTNPFLVRNPVDASRFEDADPDLFRATYGLGDYVLCVGRLEHRKNQLMLAAALASSGLPLVLIGHEADEEYGQLIRRFGGSNLHVIGRIDPNSPLLASALAGARVFALPSWAEGAPLAALEAGAAGVRMVLSDRSGEHEYFGDHADYCDPGSMASIRGKIVAAWEKPRDEAAKEALQRLIREQYDWSKHAETTRAVYEAVASRQIIAAAPTTPSPALPSPRGIIFDITTWANNPDTLSGIVRVECAIAQSLLKHDDQSVRFILYLDFARFVEVPRVVVEQVSIGSFVKVMRNFGELPSIGFDMRDFSDLITVGSSWMQSTTYAASIAGFAQQNGLRLNVLMHDLTPHLFPHWYNPGYTAIWDKNCRKIVSQADRILVYSNSTARDVDQFCRSQETQAPALAKIRLADEIGDFAIGEITAASQALRDWFSRRPFVLAVGAIHARKNYGLLYDVWTMLTESMGDAAPYLVIVGGVAWNGQELARAIREDSRVNSHIRILENVDDQLLAWFYEHCLMTAYPSLYEGWGLPVGESLSRGKICLSSAISSMPEISPEATDLLPPMDRFAWRARIEHYTRSAASREAREAEIRERFVVTSWAQTTDDIIRALRSPTRQPVPDKYLAGALVAMAMDGASRYLKEGWYGVESWGVWSGDTRAVLAFQLAGQPAGDMVFSILARVLKRAADQCTYRVIVNDVNCGVIVFGAEAKPSPIFQSVARIRVPAKALNREDGYVRIVLETDFLLRVQDVDSNSQDSRRLGLGLSAFMLEAEETAGDMPRFLSTRPEIRTMLKVPVTQDLTRMLSCHAGRTAILPNQWTSSVGDYLCAGNSQAHGAVSAEGILSLAMGTARLRLAEDATIDLVIAIDEFSNGKTDIDLFANGEPIYSCVIEAGETLVRLNLPHDTLGASDPLNLVLAVRHKASWQEFAIKKLRIRQDHKAPPLNLSHGESVVISEWLPEIAYQSGGEVSARLTVSGVNTDSVLIIRGGARQLAAAEFDGVAVSFVLDDTGEALVMLNNGLRALSQGILVWSSKMVGTDEGLITVQQLAALDAPPVAMAPRYIPSGMWNEVEEDGRHWGCCETLSFWVKPGRASGMLVLAEHLLGHRAMNSISITVAGEAVKVEIAPSEEVGQFTIRIPLPQSDDPVCLISLSGLLVVRPVDLGMNLDQRDLSLRLIELSALDGQTVMAS